jgi:hypothetical protein
MSFVPLSAFRRFQINADTRLNIQAKNSTNVWNFILDILYKIVLGEYFNKHCVFSPKLWRIDGSRILITGLIGFSSMVIVEREMYVSTYNYKLRHEDLIKKCVSVRYQEAVRFSAFSSS